MPPPAPRTGEGDDADIARVQRQVARRRDADAVLLLLPPTAASPPKDHPDGPERHAAVCASRSHEQRAGGRGRGRHGDACRGLAVRREEGDDGGGGSGDRCIGGTASGPVVGARGRRREEVAGEVERVVGDDGDGLSGEGGGGGVLHETGGACYNNSRSAHLLPLERNAEDAVAARAGLEVEGRVRLQTREKRQVTPTTTLWGPSSPPLPQPASTRRTCPRATRCPRGGARGGARRT